MLQTAPFNFRGRSAAILAAFGAASTMALGGAVIAPTIAHADATSPNAPVSTQRPVLSGSVAQGSVITMTPGTFSNETTQGDTWEQCPSAASMKCTPTSNKTNTYTVGASDSVGDYVRLDEAATNASGSNTVWSNAIGPVTAGPATAPATPVVTVSGSTLNWKALAGVDSYQLATVTNPTTTRNTTYQNVSGTSFTPTAVAGQTVNYGLEANVSGGGAPWSTEVTIHYPAATSPGQALTVAAMNTTGWGVDSIYANAGINQERLDIGEGSGIGLLKTAIANGMHPLPIYTEGPDGNLTDLTPAQVSSDITALIPQLKSLGLTTLEFGNESYLSESAATYGAQYNAAHIAAQGSGIKLLAAATTDYYEHARGGSGSWFSDLIKALPGGAGEIDALTLHPYGSMTSTGSDGYGWPMVATLHSEAVAAGISPTLPWYLTEVGQEISGSGIEGQAPVSQSTQASDLTQYLNDIKTTDTWVVYLDWYSCRDDSSGGFGLLNSDNSPRPAFTAMKNWIAANPTITNG